MSLLRSACAAVLLLVVSGGVWADGRPVTGRVLSAVTGEGIADAVVEIADNKEFDPGPFGSTTTDAEGRYRFVDLAPGKVWVRATAPGWAARYLSGTVGPGGGDDGPAVLDDLWLPRGGRIAGRVVDARGGPVADAAVVVSTVDIERIGQRLSFPTTRVSTDEAGRYAIDGITAGARYQVTVTHDDFSPAVAGPVAIDPGTVREDVDLVLKQGASLRFRLVDAEERPQTRLTMKLESEEDPRADLPYQRPSLSTEDGGIVAGEDGWLTAGSLAPGRYSVRFEPDGWVGVEREGVVLTEGETTDLGSIELRAGSWLHGRVVDEGGDPIAGAELTASWQLLAGRYDRRATSGPDGSFAIGGLPDHAVKLAVSASEFARRTLDEVTPGSEEVVVTLDRPGGIRGTVELAEGGVPSSFVVRVFDEGGVTAASEKVETPAGSFEIRDVAPGTYGAEVRAPGRAPARMEKVRVRAGEVVDVGEISLRPGLRLEGRVVVAADGAPVAGASIRVDRGAGPTSWSQDVGALTTLSATDGAFVFDQLDAGRFTLSLFHPDFAPVLRSVDLDGESRESKIEIELTAGGEIRGVVIDSDGLPVPGADLVIYRGMRGFDLRMTSTAEDGSFRFTRLAPGPYIVMRNRSRAQSPFNRQVKTVDVREGQVTRVEFR